ncbi:MAG: caspase domain-containing protein [Hyphomicrobiaceae bacterium]|nr:caspase domain-containing protein [Hyphomicrobiaceae bacterium]
MAHLAALVVILIVCLARPVEAAKRVALVVGNAGYTHAAELTNPRSDAGDMAIRLEALGFKVIAAVDLDKAGLEQTMRTFAMALKGAEAAVFYYAGHGIQVNGSNYLVPIDAELTSSSALDLELVRLDLVQRVMEAEAKTSILFLDACRNNPLTRNLARALGTRSGSIGTGLAPAESAVGTLISFSTQPGNVALDGGGRNSPFSGALARLIATPGADIVSVLTEVRKAVLEETAGKQVPWENHALLAKFYFNGRGSEATGTAAEGSGAGSVRVPRRPEPEPRVVREPYQSGGEGAPKARPQIEARERRPSPEPRVRSRITSEPKASRDASGGGASGGIALPSF